MHLPAATEGFVIEVAERTPAVVFQSLMTAELASPIKVSAYLRLPVGCVAGLLSHVSSISVTVMAASIFGHMQRLLDMANAAFGFNTETLK
jgi:hypothetical protein